MLKTIAASSLALLFIFLLYKIAGAFLRPRRHFRNDDDPFKIGSAAYFQHGPGSETWKERYGQRD